MRLPWRKKNTPAVTSVATPKPTATPSFGADLLDSTMLQYHAIRALCGALMERHSACRSPHPYCGLPGHHRNGDIHAALIIEAIPQTSSEGAAHQTSSASTSPEGQRFPPKRTAASTIPWSTSLA